ncbi:DUF4302 domain-containing protein [Aquimarina muelleri]|uniref:DUF4302 domain-containing protein n=1 Tax=Aquimarina muelleri TaxID=279356 RepID=UPI003F68967E
MLKNIKIYTLLLITLGFIACSTDNEVEPLFNQDIDTRVDTLLKSYKSTLTAPEFGWVIENDYVPSEDNASFRLHFKFNADNTVETTSDYKNGADDLPSTYRVGINQVPELVIENFSTLASLFETSGFFLQGEFEFNIKEITSERIVLESKTDQSSKSIINLVPASPTSKNEIIASRIFETRAFEGNRDINENTYRTFTVTNASNQNLYFANIFYHLNTRNFIINGTDANGNESSFILPIKTTETGFEFLIPFSLEEKSFVTFTYNETTKEYVSVVDGLTATINPNSTIGFIRNNILDLTKDQVGANGSVNHSLLYRTSLSQNLSSTKFVNDIISPMVTGLAAKNKILGDIKMRTLSNPPALGVSTGNDVLVIIVLFDANDPQASPINLLYFFSSEIENKLLKLTLRDVSSQTDIDFIPEVRPLLLNFFGNPDGLIYENQGNFRNFVNQAATLTSAQDRSINFYGVWVNF